MLNIVSFTPTAALPAVLAAVPAAELAISVYVVGCPVAELSVVSAALDASFMGSGFVSPVEAMVVIFFPAMRYVGYYK